MRETPGHRARREAFLAELLGQVSSAVALWANVEVVTHTSGGAPFGGQLVVLSLTDRQTRETYRLDNPQLANGFRLLMADRKLSRTSTAIEGISTQMRERVLVNRSVNDAASITLPELDKVIQVGLFGEVRYR